jgi:hypothetical protein
VRSRLPGQRGQFPAKFKRETFATNLPLTLKLFDASPAHGAVAVML